ncbi:hypothetical protein BDA99DRAFT_437926, partial [Phascolomyces articulosus]
MIASPPQLLEQLLILFTNFIANASKTEEEIQQLSIQCIHTTLHAVNEAGEAQQQTLREIKFRPQIAVCITALLDVIRKGDALQLRIDALHTLSTLVLTTLGEVDIIAVFLPGIASALGRTIYQKQEKENQQILSTALDVLGNVIVFVMQDERAPDFIIPKIHSLHDLLPVSTIATTIAILHIDDEYIQVASEAQLHIRDMMQVPVFEQTIIPTLKENLADSITYVPNTLISGDEGDKVTALALITGYVLILGNRHARGVLDSTITKALDAWLAAFQIDQDGLNVLEEKSQNSNKFIEFQEGGGNVHASSSWPEQQTLVYPKIRFKHLVADRTLAQAGRMLNVIGRYGSLSYWVDLYMDCFREQELDVQPQAVFIIHSLLSGASTAESNTIDAQWMANRTDNNMDETFNIKAIALHVLHEIVNLVIDPTTDSQTNVVPGGQHYKIKHELETAEILAACFGLQIVGLVACILEAEYIQDELITLLYPLLAHLGSPNVFIHTYALITLDAIALVCGQRGAQQLAVENIDYIINMVSQRISVLEDNLRAPLVLKALIRIGGPDTIDYLDDTVEEVFDALDGYHLDDWSCGQLCRVLTEIVRVVYRKNAILLELANEDAATSDQERQQKSTESQVSNEIHDLIKMNTFTRDDNDDGDKVPKNMDDIGRYFLDRQQK